MLAQYKALGWTGCTGEKFIYKFNWWKNLNYSQEQKSYPTTSNLFFITNLNQIDIFRHV